MKMLNWKYTLGEILIVIIGITIAFSMNKCANDAQNESQKQQYLINLKNDVTADKSRLEEIVVELERKIETANRILPILNSGQPDKIKIIGDIFSIATIANFSAKDITYQTLINSGDLKLIDDFDLKTAIEAHYSNYKVMMKDYERQENIHKQYLGNYFIHHVDYDAFKQGIFGFDDEKLLKNIIQSMNGSFSLKLNASKKGIESCNQLIATLSNAIDKED
jgi:hypothetical protein